MLYINLEVGVLREAMDEFNLAENTIISLKNGSIVDTYTGRIHIVPG
ncbi:MAG: hypothetical protein K8S62_01275 [Candidatus Sabulitectum sp.]|nr:hypothetical protein [Candidatus Sabulitectum sp.]